MPLLSFYRGDNVIEVSILSTCTKFASSLLTKFKIDGVSRNSHGYGGLLHCGPHNFWIFLLACSICAAVLACAALGSKRAVRCVTKGLNVATSNSKLSTQHYALFQNTCSSITYSSAYHDSLGLTLPWFYGTVYTILLVASK